ncbi:hypothetical protein CR513_07853, partial [Mucuna pruriens]
MGEKELMITTPFPTKYVEGDEEALETSFQALEIVGKTSSRATIMAAKVLISNDFQPGKGLGKELDGVAEPVALQENPERFGLGYIGTAKERRPGQTSIAISPVRPTNQELDNWTAKELLELIDNATLELNNANESHGQDKGEGPEEEALVELERLLEQERPKLQFGAEDLEIINLDENEEAREIRVGKQITLNSRQKLVELLREYTDVFA